MGLTTTEAAARLREHGPNEPCPVHRLSRAVRFLHLFANPLVVILLVASVISGSLGQFAQAVIIITIVLVGVVVDFWQTDRSQRAVERLRASVAPAATVLRDDVWRETPIRDVVPGDVVRLSAGDLVPADARLLESRDLSVQQSMLTGESLPVGKAVFGSVTGEPTGPGAAHLVFLGTSVVSGVATALVIATGASTMFGGIAARLDAGVPATEFEQGLHRFSLLILRTAIVLVLLILLVGIVLQHNALESLLFAVAVGVGLTPEFLPMIVAVALSRGALRMAREQVVVKHLPAIQNFGSIDILCSDKTGTLTSGAMRLDAVVDPLGAAASRPIALAAINSRHETGIRSPLDEAILEAGPVDDAANRKIDEIPFDFDRRRLSVVVAPADPREARHLLVTKGAPEDVLAQSTAYETAGVVQALDEPARRASTAVYRAMSAEGIRVLAVAYRWLEPRDTIRAPTNRTSCSRASSASRIRSCRTRRT